MTCLKLQRKIAMSSTVDWMDEMSSDFQTESYSHEAVTTATEQNTSVYPYKVLLIIFGFLGAVSNGFVLGGLWLAGRSKMTSSSVYIANHTTLEQSPFS